MDLLSARVIEIRGEVQLISKWRGASGVERDQELAAQLARSEPGDLSSIDMARPYTVGIGRQPYRDKINTFKATTLESGIPELRLYHDVHLEHAIFTPSTEFHDWRRSWVLDSSEIRLDREPITDALNSRSRDHGKHDPRRNRQTRFEQRPHPHSLPPGGSALMPRPNAESRSCGSGPKTCFWVNPTSVARAEV